MNSILIPLLSVLCLLSVLPVAAAELHFETLAPATEEGSWQGILAGKNVAKKKASLVFWADGQKVEAALTEIDRSHLQVTLAGVPADVRRLSVGSEGRKGPREDAAIDVGPTDSGFGGLTVYHIMMGYFLNGNPGNDGEIEGWRHDNYAGGDLQGVLAKADYLADLGVNAVWFSPLFQSRTSHGYDVMNYYRIGDSVAVPGDPEASLALFRQVRDALQERGIQVILDVPLNHGSRAYDMENGDPGGLKPRSTGARQEAEKIWEGWGASFRYWNIGNESTRRFLKDVALHWLVEEKVDGLRLDYVRGVEHEFWAELHSEVKEKKGDAWLLGECWIDQEGAEANAEEIARFYEPIDGQLQFDSLVDFPLQIVLTDVFARGGKARELERWLGATAALYGDRAQPAYFLDNHDMTRFLSWTDDSRRLTAALGFMASLSSPIILFYGTEAGLTNGGPQIGFTDKSRVPMPWNDLNEAMVRQTTKILQARKTHPALTHGGRQPLHLDDDVLVMAKVHPDETVWVGVNLAEEARTVEVPVAGGAFEALVGESLPKATDGKATWTLPPVSTTLVSLGSQ